MIVNYSFLNLKNLKWKNSWKSRKVVFLDRATIEIAIRRIEFPAIKNWERQSIG